MSRLEGLGWFRYVPASSLPIVRHQVRQSLARLRIPEADWLEDESLPPSTADRRIYMADAEDLAEGSVHEVLLAMRDALAAEKVTFGTVVSDLDEYHYDVVIDGERFVVLPKGYAPGKSWETAFLRLLEIANELLQRAGSEARLYGQSGGNDAAVVLLTPAIHDALKKLGVPATWLPKSLRDLRKAAR